MSQKVAISSFAKDARRIGREKQARVAAWIFRWGYSSRQNIAQIANDDLKYAGRMVKAGLLRRIQDAEHCRNAFVLTRSGVSLALGLLESLFEMTGGSLDYRFVNDSRIPWGRFKHENCVQKIMIKLGASADVGGFWWASEKEMASGGTEAVPDAMMVRGDERVWVEFERTVKDSESRNLQLWGRLQALKDGKFERLLWVFDESEGGVGLSLTRAFGKKVVPHTYRNRHGSIIQLGDHSESLQPLKDISQIVSLGELIRSIASKGE